MTNIGKFILIMALVFFVTGIAAYQHLPLFVASHWNAAGEANGFMSRAWGTFLFPIIFTIIALILLLIPRIDPKKENIQKFRGYFNFFIIVFSIFFYYIYLLTILWNLGYHFDFAVVLIPAFALLLFGIGMILPRTEPNWTIGIRTPWTLSSESVWKKTHELGGIIFKIAAILSLVGFFFSSYAVWFLITPIIASVIIASIYSYRLYAREQRFK